MSKVKQKIDLDLDAISDTVKSIKIDGDVIEIAEPPLDTYIDLMKLSNELQNGDGEEDMEGMQEILERFKQLFIGIAPELKDHRLSFTRCIALANLVGDMVQPTSTKYLEANGITPKEVAAKKK